jgi:nucleolar complex protein 2
MAQTKATKKFEKRRLKDTLERRNGLKRIKQKQQLKAKKKARRAEENGQPEEDPPKQQRKATAASNDAFKDMSVDDFFQGGFEVPELPKKKGSKRKRDEGDAHQAGPDVSFEEQPVGGAEDDGSASDSEDDEDHKAQLEALKARDPEFHKYLQENEPELLDAGLDDIQLSEEDEDEEEPQRKKQRQSKGGADDSDDEAAGGGKNELDKATVQKWQKALSDEHSLRAAKEVVLAFRSAAHVSEDEGKEFKYSISSPAVYHQLLTTALKHIPTVFQHHLPVQENLKTGKAHVATESKKFKSLAPLLRSQIASIIHLLDNLSDAATLRLTLTSTLPLLPYLLSFKKLVRDVARAAANVWSTPSSTEATRIAAFLVLRRLIVIGDSGIRENMLKATYQALIKGSRSTTIHTIAGVNLMKNSAAELWGLADSGVAYTTGFTFIRQLAVHLRSSITNNSNESYKTVYNWQYVHGLDFWSRVLASHATESNSPLRPLIYPLVQVTLGALRLIPTATYFPLRFQLIRSLLRISLSTNAYIPLAAPLLEVLTSAEMKKSPKASTLKPLDFATSTRAAKSYLRTRVYQDGVGEQVVELLSEFFVLWSKSIALPELALPVIVQLKRWLKAVQNREPGKGNRNQKLNSSVQLLVQKLEANSRFIEEKRAKVEFAPKDRKQVEAFLQEVNWEKTPLGAFVVGQRKAREEKARVIEEGRKEEERRRGKEKGNKGKGQAEEEEEDDEESEEEEELELHEDEDEEMESGFDGGEEGEEDGEEDGEDESE